VQLGGEAQGGGFLQELSADQQVGGLALADFSRLARGAHGRGEVSVLAQSLGENRPQGGVRIDNEDPPRMAAAIKFIRLCHDVSDYELGETSFLTD